MATPAMLPAAVAALFGCLLSVGWAAADQPRDYMFNISPEGTRFVLDYFGTGAQLSVEHNQYIYGKANSLRLRGATLLTYPLGQLEARADLRILALQLGVSAGYRTIWRNLDFEPGTNGEYCTDCDRGARRKRDPILGGDTTTAHFPFVEGRMSLFVPFNRYVVAFASWGTRHEQRQPRSFDWIYSDIHDGGWFHRFEANLFLKHPDYGGIAPYVQMLQLRRMGKTEMGWAAGFNVVTRPGIADRDDLLLLTVLIRPNDAYYGQHTYYMPVRALAIYRLYLNL